VVNMSPINIEFISAIYPDRTSTIVRDLRLNLERLLKDGALEPGEGLLTLLAVSQSLDLRELVAVAKEELRLRDFTKEEIQEAEESAAIMAMLNTYYRFKHMVAKDEDYRITSLRMTALAKPLLGKERFEMLALAVSIINGCETCIKAHELVLRNAGVSADKIHDLARLAAVLRGIKALQPGDSK
jgi:lipoyl-dependent peroxiredoxin subunit D